MARQSGTQAKAAVVVEEARGEPANAAERMLRILSLLAGEGRPGSIESISHRLEIPKGSVQRLCISLAQSGHLVRDVHEGMFTIGPAFRQLAFDALNHVTLRSERHAVLRSLVAELGETCNFTTLDGAEVLYLDRVEARRPLRLTIDVGAHVPLHCTSSGKLLLAYLPKPRRDELIARLPLTRLTSTTITEPRLLKADCEAIVERGFSRDNEEFVEGLVSIAVPVRDDVGVVRATVSVHSPKERMSLAQAEARIGTLKAAAKAMGKLI